MNNFISTYWKTILFFAVVGLFGGFFVGIYQLDSFPAEIRQQVYDQGITRIMLGVVFFMLIYILIGASKYRIFLDGDFAGRFLWYLKRRPQRKVKSIQKGMSPKN